MLQRKVYNLSSLIPEDVGYNFELSAFNNQKLLIDQCELYACALSSKAFTRLASLPPAFNAEITFFAGDCNNPMISPIRSCLLFNAFNVSSWLLPANTSPSTNAAFSVGNSPFISFLKSEMIRAGSFAFSENKRAVTPCNESNTL